MLSLPIMRLYGLFISFKDFLAKNHFFYYIFVYTGFFIYAESFEIKSHNQAIQGFTIGR